MPADPPADTTPRPLSETDRPLPVTPFPASWLALFGGLSVAATPPLPDKGRPASAEPGQGPNDPQD